MRVSHDPDENARSWELMASAAHDFLPTMIERRETSVETHGAVAMAFHDAQR